MRILRGIGRALAGWLGTALALALMLALAAWVFSLLVTWLGPATVASIWLALAFVVVVIVWRAAAVRLCAHPRTLSPRHDVVGEAERILQASRPPN